MSITPGFHTSVSGLSGGTSGGGNTSGATLLFAVLSYDGLGAGNIFDFYGNIWIPLTRYEAAGDRSCRAFYVPNPITGTGHTFSTTTGVSTLQVFAVHGTATSTVFASENGFGAVSNSIATGTVTPDGSIETILITGSQNGSSNAQSVDGYFTEIENQLLSGGNFYGQALAYAIQTSATPKQATWTFVAANASAVCIACFNGPGGAAVTVAQQVPIWALQASAQMVGQMWR